MNKFECDKRKARANYAKHHIRFTDAARAINSAFAVTGPSPQSPRVGEERHVTVTKLADGRVVVVVWSPRRGNVRLISARHARKREREALNAYLQKKLR
jgi:uncharacterized DUF497 family protein